MTYCNAQGPSTITSLEVMLGNASQLSVAEAIPVLSGVVLDMHPIVTFGGQVSNGAVSSTTTIVLLQLELFPQSSVAVHVLVTLYSAGQVPLVVTSVKVTVGNASHASVTMGGVNTGVFGQLIGVV